MLTRSGERLGVPAAKVTLASSQRCSTRRARSARSDAQRGAASGLLHELSASTPATAQ